MLHPSPLRNTRSSAFVLVACLLASTGAPGQTGDGHTWAWEGVERIVAIGDVHGSYGKLLSLLRGTGLTTQQLAWQGGEAHLVFCGDLIDRGPEGRAVLDLARRLQTEAKAAGGRVHVLLGNHEIMNMTADLRYVPPEGFQAFLNDERDADRQAAWAALTRSGRDSVRRQAFDQTYPPGFFGRMRALGPDGEYGRWLLEQPTVVKINDILFVHGGLTDLVALLGLEAINTIVRDDIESYWAAARVLAGEIAGPPTYSAIEAAAQQLAEARRDSSQRQAARRLLELHDSLAFQPEGPHWYRGNSLDNERFGRGPLDRVLTSLDARALVVAHTPTGSGKITSRFDAQLLRSDVGMAYGREPSALVMDGTDVRVFDAADRTFSPPRLEHPRGEGWSAGHSQLPDHQLEKLLARAEVLARQPLDDPEFDRHLSLIELERKGVRLRALFFFVDEGLAGENPRRYQHEAAAYWLDRRLGFEVTPVAVVRKIDGRKGTLSVNLESAIDLMYVRSRGLWSLAEGLEGQIGRLRVLTALLGVRDRHDAGIMLLPRERRLMLTDNSKAFPLSPKVADLLQDQYETTDRDGSVRYIEGAPCEYLDAGLAGALRSLERKELRSELGDYLSDRQIDTLLERRDGILAFCATWAKNGPAR